MFIVQSGVLAGVALWRWEAAQIGGVPITALEYGILDAACRDAINFARNSKPVPGRPEGSQARFVEKTTATEVWQAVEKLPATGGKFDPARVKDYLVQFEKEVSQVVDMCCMQNPNEIPLILPDIRNNPTVVYFTFPVPKDTSDEQIAVIIKNHFNTK